MTAAALPLPHAATPWARHLGTLAIVGAVLLALFAGDFADMARIWWTNTTYGHCLFIAPVVAWLLWQRRAGLARLTPAAWAPGLILVAGGGTAWLVGDAGSAAVARQLGLVAMIQGAVVTLLGLNVARALLFPLAYALFLVPFGAEFEPLLQAATVRIVMPLLHLAGIEAYSNGVLIHAGRYWFEVAEACSGSKFVLAMLAFGTLVAATCFQRWERRIVFLTVALVVPVLANGVRAAGTIWAADVWGIERASGIDHIVFGWLFFAAVMAGVLALGWRWFDRAPDAPAFDPATLQGVPRGALPLSLAAPLVLFLAMLFPAWADATSRRSVPLPARMILPDVRGWTRTALDPIAGWQPFYPGADHLLVGRYAKRAARVDVALAAFARQREGAELVAFGTGVLRQSDRWVRVADRPGIVGGAVVRIRAPGPVERDVATWYRVGDTVTANGRGVKIATVKARLLGGDQRSLALHLSAIGADAAAQIEAFLAASGGPEALAARIADAR